jgi:hypothetical protein
VSLAVFFELEAVLECAEELVGGDEEGALGAGEQVLVAEAHQGLEGGSVAEPEFTAAVEALEALDEELDIADAAGGELDVDAWGAAAAEELAVELLAGFGHLIDGAEIE